MAKRKSTKKEKGPHTHVWEVEVRYEPRYCMCLDRCDCQPSAYAEARCKCGETLDEWQIADILNSRTSI